MTISAEAIASARDVNIFTVAQRFVVLKRIATNEWAGPCPGCGGTDRFSINIRKAVFNCRGCGAKGDVIALVQLALGVGFAEAVEDLAGSGPKFGSAKPRAAVPAGEQEDAAHRTRQALAIWNGARSIRGTLAEAYLVRRSVDLAQFIELDDVLRFEPRCPFGADRLPALIALARDILPRIEPTGLVTDAPRAIQRTALDRDGQKMERMSLGRTKACAIKLWPDAEVTQGLVVGEGLETVAAAATHVEHRATLLQPAWALLDRGNLSAFPVLAGVDALTILVDNDESGDGQRAADACERRWLEAGREVIKFTPNTLGSDFNDIVRGKGA